MPKGSNSVKVQLKQESVFDVAVEMLYIALVFLAPVIFDRRIGIVFSLTKTTTIRLIMIAILTVWAIKLMLKQEHKFVRTPLDYPILSYLLACTVATLTSVHVITSFMGFYGRYEGLSTLYVYILLFFVTTNFIKTKEQIIRTMITVIIAGISMSFYGVIQRMGLDPYAWGGVITWQRVIGTIGQPNFLAAYVDMAFIIGLALLLNMKDLKLEKKLSWDSALDLSVRALLICSLLTIYICIFFTLSRGGFLGLLVGTVLFFTISNRRSVINKWRELSVLLILISIATFIISLNPEFSLFGRMTGETALSENVKEVTVSETSIVQPSSALSRLETWKSGYRIMVDWPFFGIGQEVLKMVFPRYETDKFRFYEAFHVKQDRCHNEVCDMGVTRGVITLAIYVWMLSTFYFIGFKIVRGDYDPELKLFTAGFLGAAAAYLVQNQFSFGVVAITTLLWIMMGLVMSIYNKEQPNERSKNIDLSEMPWLVFAGTLILALYLVFLSTIQFRADMHFKNGKTLADMRRFDAAIKEYETSLQISPYEGGTWTHYGIATLNLAQTAQSKEMLERAIKIFEIANKIDPYNADNFYISGRAYFILSSGDNSYLKKVVESEDNAIKIDPLYAEAYQMKGAVYEREGRDREAADMYEKTIEVNPQLGDAVGQLSNIHLKLGSANKVIDIFKSFLLKYPYNPVFQESLASVYVRRNEINKAVNIYEEMVAANPKNVRALVNLGFMSARLGRTAKAKDSFERAIMIDPKSVDAHNGMGLLYMNGGQIQKAKDEFYQSIMVDPNNEYARNMLEKIK